MFLNYFYFKYLFIWKAGLQIEKRERRRDFPFAGLLPKWPKGQDCARLPLKAWSFFKIANRGPYGDASTAGGSFTYNDTVQANIYFLK